LHVAGPRWGAGGGKQRKADMMMKKDVKLKGLPGPVKPMI